MLYIGGHVRGPHDLVDVPGAVKVSPARQKRGIGSSKRNLVPSAVAISGHKVSDVFSDRFTMFVGAAPKEFISQILDVVPFPEWNAAYVCCSGSFRPEVALRQRYPNLRIVGNDVSVLLCSTIICRTSTSSWPRRAARSMPWSGSDRAISSPRISGYTPQGRSLRGQVFCALPTYAKGYERIYKFLNDNVEWSCVPWSGVGAVGK
jgi:hypothetical protein